MPLLVLLLLLLVEGIPERHQCGINCASLINFRSTLFVINLNVNDIILIFMQYKTCLTVLILKQNLLMYCSKIKRKSQKVPEAGVSLVLVEQCITGGSDFCYKMI